MEVMLGWDRTLSAGSTLRVDGWGERDRKVRELLEWGRARSNSASKENMRRCRVHLDLAPGVVLAGPAFRRRRRAKRRKSTIAARPSRATGTATAAWRAGEQERPLQSLDWVSAAGLTVALAGMTDELDEVAKVVGACDVEDCVSAGCAVVSELVIVD